MEAGASMTLTEKVNQDIDRDERWRLVSEAGKAQSGGPSGFYVALVDDLYWSAAGWQVAYKIGLPNPDGGPRRVLQHRISSHAYDLTIVGEEQALDFVYMLNMARINRKDGA
jgi:hypothetical protein